MKLIVADSSPLIVFARAGLLTVLHQVAGDILVPEAVFGECTRETARPGAMAITEAHRNGLLAVIDEPDISTVPELRKIANLDAGELAVIALAVARECPVLLDERLGRNVAKLNGLTIVGSAGILLRAKQLGLIDRIAPVLATWRGWGYFLSSALVETILSRAGEDSEHG